MYRGEDRESLELFSEFLPFDGKLDPENRWLKTRKLIPWKNLESKYASRGVINRAPSASGRPAKDCLMVIGLLLLKHITVQ